MTVAAPAPKKAPVRKPRARKLTPVVVDPATEYAIEVCAGRVVAGPHVRDACARHLRDLEQGPKRGLRFNADKAAYYIGFFENFLRLNGGEFEGLPFVLGAWQRFIIGSLFGWEWAATGLRRFTTAYIEIGKGNGKSPMAAGIGLAGLIVDNESRAEIYAAATKKDQAMILFRDAVAMADLSPDIGRRLVKSGVGEKTWNLAYPALGSFFKPISSDDGQSGPRPHMGIVDELHEAKDGNVVDMLRRGLKGRRQPLIVEITNSGVDRQSICWAHHEASIAVLNARPGDKGFDDKWFSYVCALDPGDDWLNDESCWPKANPNIGVSMPWDRLRDAVREARNIPSRQNLIARLHFCCWTESVAAWIGHEAWEAVQVAPAQQEFRGRRAYLGIDLSSIRDLTAVAVFVPDERGGGDAWVEFWSPEEGILQREDIDGAPYSLWKRGGHLTTTEGASVNYAAVVPRLGELHVEHEIAAAAFDRWRINDLKRELDRADLDLPLVEFGQGFKDMAPAIQALEGMILNKTLRIHRNPVLTWNAASAVIEEDAAANRKFTKRKATGRIDGIVALTMAIGAAAKEHEPDVPVIDQGFVRL